MSDYITDREIERLALGELGEAEANELMKRLEERGELERLEAIIADDEAFLEAHPPALLASQVRSEVRRRTREHHAKEPTMLRPSRSPLPIVIGAGFAAAAIVFAVLYVQSLDAPAPPEPVATMTNGQTNTAAPSPTPTPEPTPEPAPEPPKQPTGQTLLDHGVEVPMPTTFYLALGEIVEAPAKGIMRISISSTKIIDATIHEQKTFYLEGKETGQTVLSLTRKDDGHEDTRSALMIVGEALTDEVVRGLMEQEPSLSTCAPFADGSVTLRIVAQHASTFVGNAHMGGKDLSPELKRCIDGVVARWNVGALVEPIKHSDGQLYARGPSNLSVGTIRYDFRKGAMCAPNDDDC